MLKFLLLAFKNVFRNRRRTAMTLVMVGGGVAGLLLVGGFFASMFMRLRESTIHDGLGHLQIYNAEHFRRDEVHALDTGVGNWQQIASLVSTNQHVLGVAPRIDFYGMLSNGMKSSVFMGTAVDPKAEKGMGFVLNITSGRDLDSGPGPEVEALIGAGVARSMNVKVGDGLTLLTVTSDGALNGIDVQIVGIVSTGTKEIDDRYLRITLPSAQRLLQSNRITNLVVGLDKTENTDAVYAELGSRLQGLSQDLTIKKWIELAAYYKQVRTLFSGIFIFLGIIVFFMVVMSGANTLLMAMFERTREIGTMLAMGTPRSWIVGLFILEATLTGALGALLGIVVGNVLGSILNHLGLHLPPAPGHTDPFSFTVLHVPSLMIASSLLLVFTLALASILPAIRASRMQIAEALTHV